MTPWLTKSARESEEAVLARENSLKQLHIYYSQICNILDLAVLILEKYAGVEVGISLHFGNYFHKFIKIACVLPEEETWNAEDVVQKQVESYSKGTFPFISWKIKKLRI